MKTSGRLLHEATDFVWEGFCHVAKGTATIATVWVLIAFVWPAIERFGAWILASIFG